MHYIRHGIRGEGKGSAGERISVTSYSAESAEKEIYRRHRHHCLIFCGIQ